MASNETSNQDKQVLVPPAIRLQGQTTPNRTVRYTSKSDIAITCVSRSKDGKDVYFSFTLDMNDLPTSEVYEMAAKSILIGWVRKGLIRKTMASEVIKDVHGSTVLASNYRPETTSASPEDKVIRALKGVEKSRFMKFQTDELGVTLEQAEVMWKHFCKRNGLRVSDGKPLASQESKEKAPITKLRKKGAKNNQ